LFTSPAHLKAIKLSELAKQKSSEKRGSRSVSPLLYNTLNKNMAGSVLDSIALDLLTSRPGSH